MAENWEELGLMYNSLSWIAKRVAFLFTHCEKDELGDIGCPHHD